MTKSVDYYGLPMPIPYVDDNFWLVTQGNGEIWIFYDEPFIRSGAIWDSELGGEYLGISEQQNEAAGRVRYNGEGNKNWWKGTKKEFTKFGEVIL